MIQQAEALGRLFRLADPPLYLATTSWKGRDNGWIISYATRLHLDLAPTYMVVCVSQANFSYELVAGSRIIALHLLRKDQWPWIGHFGRQSARTVEKLDGIRVERRATGAPILPDSVGYLETRALSTLNPNGPGDHTAYLTEVIGCELFHAGPVLSMQDAYEHGFA